MRLPGHRAGLIVLALTLLPGMPGSAQEPERVPLDLLASLGWSGDYVDRLLAAPRRGGQPSVHIDLTLQDPAGRYLAEARVRLDWEGGGRDFPISRSGILHLDLTPQRRKGLVIQAPAPYTTLRQRSLPDAPGYEPEPAIGGGYENLVAAGDLVDDRRLRNLLDAGLAGLAASGPPTPADTLRDQRNRSYCTMGLLSTPGPEQPPLSTAEIARRLRDAVVVVGVSDGSGSYSGASGVCIHPHGVIATNHHVLDRLRGPRGAAGVLTRDGRFFPVVEVLAASAADDVALLKIPFDGTLYPAAPLSLGDPPGEPLTVISHPDGRYYCVTSGLLSRYATQEAFGRPIVVLSLTADYAIGSSGAPIFNSRGAVAGLAARTVNVGSQMVFKDGPPAAAIRALVREPDAPR